MGRLEHLVCVVGLVGCVEGAPIRVDDPVGGGTSTTGAAPEPEGSEASGALLDVAMQPDVAVARGCRGIDFLFVIDASGSMSTKQEALIASFPGFVETIRGTIADGADSYRVLVADTGDCSHRCSIPPTDTMCGSLWCDEYPPAGSSCGTTLGAGRVEDADGNACSLGGGRRFLDGDEIDVSEAFACIASVGDTGSGAERPMEAMVAALGDELGGEGGCNEGFLRPGSILVVTFITDEEDDPKDEWGGSPGDPPDWAEAVLAAKQDDANGVVVLGLIGDTGTPGGLCTPKGSDQGTEGENGPRLREFVDLFGGRGLWGSVCEPNYAPFFDQAVALIDTACDAYVPPEG